MPPLPSRLHLTRLRLRSAPSTGQVARIWSGLPITVSELGTLRESLALDTAQPAHGPPDGSRGRWPDGSTRATIRSTLIYGRGNPGAPKTLPFTFGLNSSLN